jgi:hypothetical protein
MQLSVDFSAHHNMTLKNTRTSIPMAALFVDMSKAF